MVKKGAKAPAPRNPPARRSSSASSSHPAEEPESEVVVLDPPSPSRSTIKRSASVAFPAMSTAKKRTFVNIFAEMPSTDPKLFPEWWGRLQESVLAIFSLKPIQWGLQNLVQDCQKCCEVEQGQRQAEMYRQLGKMVQDQTRAILATTRQAAEQGDLNMLNTVHGLFDNFMHGMLTIRKIFIDFDQKWVLREGKRQLCDVGLVSFWDEVMVGENGVKEGFLRATLQLIENERNAETVNRTLLKGAIRMLMDMSHYESDFEARFLETSKAYFDALGVRSIAELDGVAYITLVEKRLEDERARAAFCLHQNTAPKLIAVVDKSLIVAQSSTLLDKAIFPLINDMRVAELRRLYDLFARIQGLSQIGERFKRYIISTGEAIVMDTSRDDTQTRDLIDFKRRMDRICRESFDNYQPHQHALQIAFEMFINQRENKPAELLAKHVDDLLRTLKDRSDVQQDEEISASIVIFRFLRGADIFEAFYRKDLAKRLLFSKCDPDAERSVIARLRTERGGQFTRNLEGMLRDYEGSDQINKDFKAQSAAEGIRVDLTVAVLASNNWPTYAQHDLTLPREIAAAQDSFRRFYTQRFQGRRLTFLPTLGTAELTLKTATSTHLIILPMLQALILLQYVSDSSHTYAQLRERLSFKPEAEKEVKRNLLNLALGKIKLLGFRPAVKPVVEKNAEPPVLDADVFRFNADFKSENRVVRITNFVFKETAEEHKETTDKVYHDRLYVIDAVVVRIMKARKTLDHSQLIAEVISQLKFRAAVPDIKKRFESLIEQEYMRRSDKNSSIYEYVA